MTANSLRGLNSVPLDDASSIFLEAARRQVTGDPVWQRRKLLELSQVLRLCRLAPYRLKFLMADLKSEPLRLILELRCPTPLQPRNEGSIQVAPGVELGIIFPREVLIKNLPGTRFVQILSSDEVFHPSVSAAHPHVLCLGATLPRGSISVCELLILSYAALSLAPQVITLDRFDPAGILNEQAALWFQTTGMYPLTTEPFLRREGENQPETSRKAESSKGGA
jgi:hypothetical protein